MFINYSKIALVLSLTLCTEWYNQTNNSVYRLTLREFSTPRRGFNTPNFRTTPPDSSPGNPPDRSQGVLNVAFTVNLLSWSMNTGNNNSPPSDSRDLPRPDPRSELDSPSYEILWNTLRTSCLHYRPSATMEVSVWSLYEYVRLTLTTACTLALKRM